MTQREFHGEEFWRFMVRDFEYIRHWRKSIGNPTEHDRALMPAMKAFESFYRAQGV